MGAEGVGADDARQLGRVGVGHRVPAAGDPGVVDEDVDMAERRQGAVDHGLVLVHRIDRRLVGGAPPTQTFDRPDGLFGGLFVPAVVDGDVGPVGGERQGDGPADTPAPSGDEGDAPLERHIEGQ